MSQLVERLIGSSDTLVKLPVHQFIGAIAENKRGILTAAQVTAMFNLDAGEQADVVTILAGSATREIMHDVLMLGERGLYTQAQVETRLGL